MKAETVHHRDRTIGRIRAAKAKAHALKSVQFASVPLVKSEPPTADKPNPFWRYRAASFWARFFDMEAL